MQTSISLVGEVVLKNEPWIGVDLDGTLAEYHGWEGPDVIGKPVPAMMDRMKQWLAEGKCVKIFTSRAGIPEYVPPIRAWLLQNGLPDLEITDKKDHDMVEMWDDRARRVEMNTGKVAKMNSKISLVGEIELEKGGPGSGPHPGQGRFKVGQKVAIGRAQGKITAIRPHPRIPGAWEHDVKFKDPANGAGSYPGSQLTAL